MSTQHDFPDNLLHAFVDGQLHGVDRERLLAAMESDGPLRERVCALHRTKEWVNLAFESTAPPSCRLHTPMRRWPRQGLRGLAASLLLFAAGFLLGWVVQEAQRPHEPISSVVLRDIEAGRYKVVLHIDRSDATRFEEVLDSAEYLLKTYRDSGVEVEVLANAGGIDLLRVDVSPYARRVARLMSEYDNLRFIACANSLQRLQEKGIKPILIDRARTETTAVEHIAQRLQQGWAYVRL
jgi:intracellular sulfur oxidation DsrE/DsrF family protein